MRDPQTVPTAPFDFFFFFFFHWFGLFYFFFLLVQASVLGFFFSFFFFLLSLVRSSVLVFIFLFFILASVSLGTEKKKKKKSVLADRYGPTNSVKNIEWWKLGDDAKWVWKIEWWVMSNEWWKFSDGNWVMKFSYPNSPLMWQCRCHDLNVESLTLRCSVIFRLSCHVSMESRQWRQR